MISIIVPVYNAEKYLARCLCSILIQENRDFECIMINDGSSDNSALICKQYSSLDERFQYYCQENKGVSAARNLGLKVARGEYITFVDSDDWIHKLYLSELLENLKKTNADIAYCHATDVKEGELFETGKLNHIYHVLTLPNFSWIDYKTSHFTIWGGLYKRKLFTELTFAEELSIGEDTLLLSQILLRAKIICSLEDNLYFYSIINTSLYHSQFCDRRYDEIIVWDKICNEWENKNESIIAYTWRMQELWRLYRDDSLFSVYKKDLNLRYRKVFVENIKYFSKQKNVKQICKLWIYLIAMHL